MLALEILVYTACILAIEILVYTACILAVEILVYTACTVSPHLSLSHATVLLNSIYRIHFSNFMSGIVIKAVLSYLNQLDRGNNQYQPIPRPIYITVEQTILKVQTVSP